MARNRIERGRAFRPFHLRFNYVNSLLQRQHAEDEGEEGLGMGRGESCWNREEDVGSGTAVRQL